MAIQVDWEPSPVLDVPVLSSSPLCFELEVEREIATNSGDGTVFLCRIRNTLKEEALIHPALTDEARLRMAAPVYTCIDCDYWSWDGRPLGKWHERAKEIKPDVEIGAAARGN